MYLVYDTIDGDIYPLIICSNRSDAEEMCLTLAWEEFHRRNFMNSQFAFPHSYKTIYGEEIPTLNNSGNYNVMEVPYIA